MNTPNALLLEVTLPKSLPTLRRTAELCSIAHSYKIKGQSFVFKYWFIRYGKSLPQKELERGVIPELLTLCPPNLPDYAPKPQRVISEGQTIQKKVLLENQAEQVEINKESLIRFLNFYGVLGLDSPLRSGINRQMFQADLWNWFRISPTHSRMIWKNKEAIQAFKSHQLEIAKGNEIPLYIVETNIRDLARFARLVIALGESKESKGERYAKRIVTAWQQVIPVPDYGKGSDPASDTYAKRKVWKSKNKEGLTVLDPINVSRIFDDFASRLNFFLKPLTSLAVTTERIQSFKEKGFGFEVTFSAYCLNALKDEKKIVKRCAVCQLPFIPTRNKKEGVYCPRCKNAESQRRYRNRKRTK